MGTKTVFKGDTADQAKRFSDWPLILEKYGIYIALIIVLVIAGIIAPAIYQPGNIFNVLRQASMLGIVSIGQTLVILGAGIDLSVGAVMGLAMIIASDVTGGENDLIVLAVLLAFAAGAAVGLINGLLVTKRNVPPFVATLGMLVVVEGLRLSYTRGIPSGSIPTTLRFFGRDSVGPVPTSFVILLIVAVIFGLVLKRSTFGRSLYATGGNPEAARLSGIRVHRVLIATYIICSSLAILTGLLLSGYIGYVDRYLGRGFDLDSIAAVIVGGTSFAGGRGGILGTLAGVLLVTALLNIVLILNLNLQWQLVVKGLVIIGAVVLYSFRSRN
jgi:ribose/xylose/arabinose/galactoside ABC-type transport system permease subunit